ncbi:hypothetical protein E2C01_025431 [Portunus trituberculatus]|uniref:Uncharacterized protein n=1 Tax=Portunus trituberculatus TaxID=210409 RepID=A0A5B7EFK8_PORTR|nr:hypothetical protein [Portunus trituberculatus]
MAGAVRWWCWITGAAPDVVAPPIVYRKASNSMAFASACCTSTRSAPAGSPVDLQKHHKRVPSPSPLGSLGIHAAPAIPQTAPTVVVTHLAAASTPQPGTCCQNASSMNVVYDARWVAVMCARIFSTGPCWLTISLSTSALSLGKQLKLCLVHLPGHLSTKFCQFAQDRDSSCKPGRWQQRKVVESMFHFTFPMPTQPSSFTVFSIPAHCLPAFHCLSTLNQPWCVHAGIPLAKISPLASQTPDINCYDACPDNLNRSNGNSTTRHSSCPGDKVQGSNIQRKMKV